MNFEPPPPHYVLPSSILLPTIIPIFVSLCFHMFDKMLMRRIKKKNDDELKKITIRFFLLF